MNDSFMTCVHNFMFNGPYCKYRQIIHFNYFPKRILIKLLAKHLIRVRSELLCDYSKNPELISGAFPCLFPLGLTAEDAGGTGLLSKVQMRTLLLNNDRRFAEDKTFLL